MKSDSSEYRELVQERWRSVLSGSEHGASHRSKHLRHLLQLKRSIYGLLPGDRRCKVCNAPLRKAPTASVGTLFTKRPSNVTALLCKHCETLARKHLGGVEIELSMLFVDVRGSTSIAQEMVATEFSQLINRFYKATSGVLMRSNALIERLIGDQVVGFFVPGIAGEEHARLAIEAAIEMLRVTDHGDPNGAWIPLGIGVHTGTAYVGSVGSPYGVTDITALGDDVNVAARLGSQARAGEIIISEDTCKAAGLNADGMEQRRLQLKGRSEAVDVRIMHSAPAETPHKT